MTKTRLQALLVEDAHALALDFATKRERTRESDKTFEDRTHALTILSNVEEIQPLYGASKNNGMT